ncbi:MAG TPA: AsmA family protein [Terriglobia bacterium]|nr:AsmA family protein [Terriglobia bacterium]
MSRRLKLTLAALLTLAVIILVVTIVVPRLVNLDRYRPEVIANIERGTGRSVSIGRLSVSILPRLAVEADDIAIGNPPGFPEGHLLEIRRVYAEINLRKLLDREVQMTSLEFDHPAVNLLSTRDGRWNTEGPARGPVRSTAVRPAAWAPQPAVSSQTINQVVFEHGRVTASNLLPSGEIAPASFEADDVEVELESVNPAALGLNLTPANLGCENRVAPRLISSLASAIVPRLRPAVLASGAGGALTPPPGRIAARGTFTAKSARFDAARAGNLKSQIELRSGGVMLRQFSMELAGGHVTGDLAWNSAGRPASYATGIALTNIDLARLLAPFPGASGRITGTLEGRLRLDGLNLPSSDPLADKQGQGEITVRNGTLPTLQLNRNLMDLMKNVLKTRPEAGEPSSFQSIKADLEIAGGEIRSRQITIVGNGMDIDASGALALVGAGRLDYQGVSKMDARKNGFEGIVAGLLGSKISADGRIDVPFILTGTLDRPRVALKNSPLFH